MVALLLHGAIPHCHHSAELVSAFESAAVCREDHAADCEARGHHAGLCSHDHGAGHAHGCSVHTFFRAISFKYTPGADVVAALCPHHAEQMLLPAGRRLPWRMRNTPADPDELFYSVRALRAPPGIF